MLRTFRAPIVSAARRGRCNLKVAASNSGARRYNIIVVHGREFVTFFRAMFLQSIRANGVPLRSRNEMANFMPDADYCSTLPLRLDLPG